MRVVVQLVKESSVKINGVIKGEIKKGFLVLIGITHNDKESDANWVLDKLVKLRVFKDENGNMNKSLLDTNGAVLLVSQFTLFASTKKGNRPSFLNAAPPKIAEKLYDYSIEYLKSKHKIKVETGVFGSMMDVG
ncbi:MAG: D-aminoacyl-tRNA deacylase [Flavobacteriales bacterium]|nr:D-aminoacyl-tRNA deacylase [Flavobacteriales bacterium]